MIDARSPGAQSGFYRFSVDRDRLAGAADFGFLNRPIEPADRVFVRGAHFYTERGERIRFFGVNLAFGANFLAQADAPRIAKRLLPPGG